MIFKKISIYFIAYLLNTFLAFQLNLSQSLVAKMMMIAPPTRLAGTKIVSILVSFQGTHAPTQPHVPSVIINPFAHVHLVMKKMLMVNVLQVKISNQNSTITYYN